MNSRERIRICNKQERGGSLNSNIVFRRLLVLCEGRQYVEAQHLINRLSPSALCLIACEMPLDLLAEALPYSSSLLECLFSRYYYFRIQQSHFHMNLHHIFIFLFFLIKFSPLHSSRFTLC